MSWLAGETKWWLVLAALLGLVVTMLFQLRKVQVRNAKAVRGGMTVAAAGGAASAAAVVAPGSVAAKDRAEGITTPSFGTPEPGLHKSAFEPPVFGKADLDGDRASYDRRPEFGNRAGRGSEHDSPGGTLTNGITGVDEQTRLRPRRDTGPTPGRFGPGSADGLADGSAPHGYATPPTGRRIADTPAAEVPVGRFGAGSVDALADGSAPRSGYAIKGNADSMKFHTAESPYYGRTKAEVWFDSEEAARAAGFHRWDERPR